MQRLLAEVPQLRAPYEEEMEWLQEELPHVLFGLVVCPFILQQLQEQQDLDTIFAFLEKMAASEDERTVELLVVSVLENLISERKLLGAAKSFMGEHTRSLCEVTEKHYGLRVEPCTE